VERLVRKSPTEKAPRPDKERERIRLEDEDVDKDDKDLSMNYKDIGGTVVMAMYVASTYMKRAMDFPSEPAFKGYMEEHPDADPSNHTIDGESSDKVLNKAPEPTKKPKKESEPAPKPAPKKKEPSGEVSRELETEALYDAAENGTEEERDAAMKIIQERKKPLPPDMPDSSKFKGELGEKAVESLKKQIKSWDALDYSQNMFELETDKHMAMMAGNDRDRDYFQSIMEVYEDSSAAVRTVDLREVDSPEELLDIEDPDGAFGEDDARDLQKKKKDWYQSSMFSPLNTVGGQLTKTQDLLEKVDPDSKKGAYLKEMASVLEDVRDRKMLDKNSTADRLLIGIRDSDSEALKDLDPGEYDFTNPQEIGDFVGKVESLSSADLAQLVKDEPLYRMHFSFGEGDNPDEVSITDRERRSFVDSLREDLSVRGTFEQVRFHDDDTNSMFDKGSLLAYRDKALKDLQDQGFDLTSPENSHAKPFWDTFFDWMSDMGSKMSHVDNARAVQAGIQSAFQKAGLSQVSR